MNNAMKVLLPFFLCMLSVSMLSSCSNGWSDEDEEFTSAYAEILLAREQFPDTAAGNAAVLSIIRKHGMEEPEFRKRFMTYTGTPDKLRAIMDSAHTRIQQGRAGK